MVGRSRFALERLDLPRHSSHVAQLFSLGGFESTMIDQVPEHWRVEVVVNGRSGSIGYYEGTSCISFDWEFGGGNTVAIIWVGEPSIWSTRYAWAVSRRGEILERVAQEIVRQKAPTCRAEIDEQNGYIYIYEPAA